MRDTFLLSAAFASTCLAFASFALTQKRHWQAVTGTHDCAPSGKRFLRTGGVICLGAGCAIVIWREGADYGALLWVTQLTLAAFCVVLALCLRPGVLKPLTIGLREASKTGVRDDH